MSATLVSTPPTSPDSCISLASSLRCYYSGHGSELYHSLSILPVALEVIFTSALLFTNWRSGWRHLFLVAEGFLDFLLALLEVLSFAIPAVRFNISHFKAFDQAIGAHSFAPLFFSMSFLYVWVRAECLPITPTRVQAIARLLLFMVIPAVIIVNMVASFAGISYSSGPHHVRVTFAHPKDNFVWTFFSSLTLALLTLFKTSCLCFAFYRLIRATFTQRYFETTSKDAAVLFRGIGWMNGGIFLGAIETIIGFVFFGIPIAYVRRVLRLLSLALISIGVAKGIDGVEDFGEIRNELRKSRSANPNFRRSKLRELISNPRLSTFHQLSPTATAFHARPRAPFVTSQDFANAASSRATGGFPDTEDYPVVRTMSYIPSPATGNRTVDLPDASPRPSLQNGLPGMSGFARLKEKRMPERSRRRVTIYYNDGTPTLHLSLPSLDFSYPASIAESRRRSMGSVPRARRKFLSQTAGKSRFSTSSESLIDPDMVSVYPASTVDRRTRQSDVGYKSKDGLYDSSPRRHTMASSFTTAEARGHGRGGFNKDTLTTPTRFDFTKRFSGVSDSSGLSAAQAEIIDAPRRQLSFRRGKSTLARAVLYPTPGKNVVMALTRDEKEGVTPAPTPIRQLPSLPNPSLKVDESKLLINRRLSPLHLAPIRTSSPAFISPPRSPLQRYSVMDEDGSIITVTAISPTEEEMEPGEKRSTRKASEYSVRSIQETLQAVREMADKFPVLPPGAVGVGNESASPSRYRRPLTVGSTDTEEFVKSRIPAEKMMKGRAGSVNPGPLGTSGREIQQPLSAPLPVKNTTTTTTPGTRISGQQQLPSPIPTRFDDTDDDGMAGTNQLSPLSMSVKLRHPQSLVSNLNTPRSIIGSPKVKSKGYYHDGMDTIDFGMALRELGVDGGRKRGGVRVTGDLASIVGSSRRRSGQGGYSVTSEESLGGLPEQFEARDTEVGAAGNEEGSLMRIKNIGNAPRRVRPQPVVGHRTLGSLHVHPIDVSSGWRDEPMPSGGLGGSRDGVNAVTLE